MKQPSEIEGWMSERELEVLQKLASKYKYIVEVGSWKGRSTAALADGNSHIRDGIVCAIDTWRGTPSERETYHAEVHTTHIFPIFMENMQGRPNVGPMILESTAAAQFFAREEVDMVFLDGDHSYEAVAADIEAWWPKLRAGGVMVGHDYTHPEVGEGGWPGVKRAVDEAFGPKVAIINGTTLWMATKPILEVGKET